MTRRSFPRRDRIHYDNRLKELLVEKQDSPICPWSHLTSHFISRRRTSRDRARNIFPEGQFLHLTVPAKRTMISGRFKHEVNDSRAVVADFYCYIWCVDVEHYAQVGGILKFHFPCNNIRSGALVDARSGKCNAQLKSGMDHFFYGITTIFMELPLSDKWQLFLILCNYFYGIAAILVEFQLYRIISTLTKYHTFFGAAWPRSIQIVMISFWGTVSPRSRGTSTWWLWSQSAVVSTSNGGTVCPRFSSNLQMCGHPTTEHLRYVTLTPTLWFIL